MAVSFPDSLYVVTGNLAELEESSCTAVSGGDEGSAGRGVCEEHLLTGHTGAVVCLAMYEDRLLFSGSTDCTIKVLTTHSPFHDIPVFPNIPVFPDSLAFLNLPVAVNRQMVKTCPPA